MKAVANKYMRARLEVDTIKQLKKQYPHFEFEHRIRKVPIYPKIVVYSSVASVDKFLERYYSSYLESCPPTSLKDLSLLLKVMRSWPEGSQHN